MALLRVYPLHSEETGSFSDLYLPGSPDSVQQMCVFCDEKGLSVRSGSCLHLPPTESLSESSITNNICCTEVFLHFLHYAIHLSVYIVLDMYETTESNLVFKCK